VTAKTPIPTVRRYTACQPHDTMLYGRAIVIVLRRPAL